jgi:hypothetical protein
MMASMEETPAWDAGLGVLVRFAAGRWWSVALAMLIVACGGEPAEGPAEAPGAEAPSGPPLPRVWTLGPAAAELPEPKIEVVLHGDGRVTIDGVRMDPDSLRDALAAFSDRKRDSSDSWHPGLGYVVLRCHRRLPWRAVQRVLLEATSVKVRLFRILYVVEPVGGGAEGTLALYLGLESPRRDAPDDGERGHTVTVHTKTGAPAAPLDLLQAFRGEGAATSERGFQLSAWPKAPVENVLQVVDLLAREGVTEIHVVGPPPQARRMAAPRVSDTDGVLPGIRFDGWYLAQESDLPEPEVRRSKDLAGFTTAPHARPISYFLPPPAWHRRSPRGPIIQNHLNRLKKLQQEDGSFGGRIEETALVLVAAHAVGATSRTSPWSEELGRGYGFLLASGMPSAGPTTVTRDGALTLAALVGAVDSSRREVDRRDVQTILDGAIVANAHGPIAAWLERARVLAAADIRLRAPKSTPEGWLLTPVPGDEGRALRALSGEMGAAEVAAWQEEIARRPVEGMTVEEIAWALMALSVDPRSR